MTDEAERVAYDIYGDDLEIGLSFDGLPLIGLPGIIYQFNVDPDELRRIGAMFLFAADSLDEVTGEIAENLMATAFERGKADGV